MTEVAQVKARQEEEVSAMKGLSDRLLKDRASRKGAKQYQKNMSRDSKQKDSIIQDQEAAHKKAKEVKTVLSEHLQRVDQLIQHTEEKHKKQLQLLVNSQERKIADQRILMDLSIKNLDEDAKGDQRKEFNFKINHQKNLDKKTSDQMREKQALELRQLKDRMDLETMVKEDLSALKASHLVIQQQTTRSQRDEYLVEKDRIESSREAQKVMRLQVQDNVQLNKLIGSHRTQVS